MSHEHKVALEKIVGLLQKSSNVTKRQERIFDIALAALGLTANQRELEINKVRSEYRIQQIQKQREKMIARRAAIGRENNDNGN